MTRSRVTSRMPTSAKAAKASRSGSETWVAPSKALMSHTSSSRGATFQSPTSASGRSGSASSQAATSSRSTRSQSSL